MATHSSILVWEISQTEKTGGLQSVGVTKSWTCLNTHTHTHTHTLNKTIIELVTHGICCSSCFREVTSSFYYIVSVRVHRINKFLTTTVSVSAFLEFGFHYNQYILLIAQNCQNLQSLSCFSLQWSVTFIDMENQTGVILNMGEKWR